jgi:hypothetical protein
VREHDGYDALNEAVLAKDSDLMGILTVREEWTDDETGVKLPLASRFSPLHPRESTSQESRHRLSIVLRAAPGACGDTPVLCCYPLMRQQERPRRTWEALRAR